MNTDIYAILVADIAQCMQQHVNQIAEDYYLDLYRSEVVGVHFFHHWLSSNGEKPSLLLPRTDGNWSKGLRAVTEMQQHPQQYARIPKIKSSVRKAFMLELADRFPQVRTALLAQVAHLENAELGYDFAVFVKAVEDPRVRELIQGQIGEFFLQKAMTWMSSLQRIAA
jgi:hypothetical protein